jgi:NAD(P)-dependent dehydrogenase (short-subunit alcohol dehydrogenase family)
LNNDFQDQIALVTGASRGIGASVALQLAERGADLAINYRSKGPRAEAVAAQVRALGRRALLAQADLTSPDERAALAQAVREHYGRLDVLVLNASGGLEKDQPADYALRLNLTAQVETVTALLPLLPAGGCIVFVTSHWAHFHGQRPALPAYEPVAASKKAGEQALRERIPELSARGVRLAVVSGDVIEGTITPKLLERAQPGVLETRRAEAGVLPTVAEFAQAIVDAAAARDLPSGHTVFVGSTD